MAASIELLRQIQLSGDFTQSSAEAVDVLSYNSCVVQVWLEETLSGGETVDVYLQHAAVNEDDAFVDLSSVAIAAFTNLTSSPILDAPSDAFARFLRVRVELGGGATVATLRVEMVLKKAV